ADATTRIFFEGSNLPQDNITFKSDANGKVIADNINTNDFFVKSGQFITYEIIDDPTLVTGSNQRAKILTGDELKQAASSLLQAMPDNFQKLRIIGTKDAIFNDGFALGPSSLSFAVTDEKPQLLDTININDYPSMFHDP